MLSGLLPNPKLEASVLSVWCVYQHFKKSTNISSSELLIQYKIER